MDVFQSFLEESLETHGGLVASIGFVNFQCISIYVSNCAGMIEIPLVSNNFR